MNDKVDVSIIIVSYNTRQYLKDCLLSIQEKTAGISYEVIVADNDSKDGSLEMVQEEFPWVYAFNTGGNIGFGRANNRGLEYAKGRNIFFLNSDTLLINNAVKILSDLLDKDSSIGAAGGNLYTQTLSPCHSFKRVFPGILDALDFVMLTLISKILFRKNIWFNHSSHLLKVARVSGADMMIKKSVLTKTGAFDENIFMYSDETELCFRIKKAGFLIVSMPEAKIIHLEGGSSRKNDKSSLDFKAKQGLFSLKYFLKKRYTNRAIYSICCVFYKIAFLVLTVIFYLRKNDIYNIHNYQSKNMMAEIQ